MLPGTLAQWHGVCSVGETSTSTIVLPTSDPRAILEASGIDLGVESSPPVAVPDASHEQLTQKMHYAWVSS